MIDMEHWQEDPRLKQMDPKKLQYITDFAGRLTSMSKNQLIPALLQLQADAARNHIRFSDPETRASGFYPERRHGSCGKKEAGNPAIFCKKTGCQVLLTAGLIFCFLFYHSALPERSPLAGSISRKLLRLERAASVANLYSICASGI